MVGVAPDGIGDFVIVETIEEAFLHYVIECIGKISLSWSGIESYVKLGGNSRGLASSVDITQGHNSCLTSVERSDESSIAENFNNGSTNIL